MGWTDRLWFSSKGKPHEEVKEEPAPTTINNTPSARITQFLDAYVEIPPETRETLGNLSNFTETQKIFVGVLATTSFAIGFKAGRGWTNPWRRFATVRDIPSSYFGETAPFLRGRVLSVSDGDTIRVRHTPSRFFQSSTLAEGEKLSEVALPIRLCTIDTPETAKFGKPGQPFGEEAKEYLSNMVQDKIVHFQLLQADQYGRAVAQVKVGPVWFWQKYVDEKMLQAGLAEVYLGSGAVYGRKGKDAYLAMMETAKEKKKGMWKQGDLRETAAEYKARMKAES